MALIVFFQALTRQVVLFRSHMQHTLAHKYADHTLNTVISSSTDLQEGRPRFLPSSWTTTDALSLATSQDNLVGSGNQPQSSKWPSPSDRQHWDITAGQQSHLSFYDSFNIESAPQWRLKQGRSGATSNRRDSDSSGAVQNILLWLLDGDRVSILRGDCAVLCAAESL